jgi:hypothetical protein
MRRPSRILLAACLALFLGAAALLRALPASAGTSGATGSRGLSSGSVTVDFDGTSVTLSGAYLVDGESVTLSGGTYASTTADQTVFLVVNGGSLTLDGATITKSGGPSGGGVDDSYNFYGKNSIVLVVGEGSRATLRDCTLTSDSEGSNAVVATQGGTATASGLTIRTSGGSSRGLHATYGGIISASDVDIVTTGAHCAPIATDRGGGTVTVTGASRVNASGEGSPCIYSTGTISATGLTGTATGSQFAVIEGFNSITLTNCNLTGGGGNDSHGVMLYQSGSGDAESGISTFTCSGSTLTFTGSGAMFYTTNTRCVVALTGSTLTGGDTLIRAAADRWGTSGSNGGHITFTADDQALTGDLACDALSSIVLNLSDDSPGRQKSGTPPTSPSTPAVDPASRRPGADGLRRLPPPPLGRLSPTARPRPPSSGGGCDAGLGGFGPLTRAAALPALLLRGRR